MSKMTTQERKELALKIATDNNVQVVYANSKDEFFTNLNRAEDSDDKKNIETFDFSKVAASSDESDKDDSGGTGKDVKLYKLTKADADKYPELAANGWKEGDEVKELDWAIKNKKAAVPPAKQ